MTGVAAILHDKPDLTGRFVEPCCLGITRAEVSGPAVGPIRRVVVEGAGGTIDGHSEMPGILLADLLLVLTLDSFAALRLSTSLTLGTSQCNGLLAGTLSLVFALLVLLLCGL